MMSRPQIAQRCILAASVCLGLVAGTAPGQQGQARPKTKAVNPTELKRLESKVEDVCNSFLRDTTQLIASFEEVGQYDRARFLLEALHKLDPKNEPVKNKLAELSERILDANEFEVDVEPGNTWQPLGIVTKGQTLRIRVSGDYKLMASITATADGAPSDNPAEDLIAHVPFGAVMAVIATPGGTDRPGGNQRNRNDGKQPRPFTVGSLYEKPADQDGLLYLKVNVPPGAKCTGRLKAKISGAEKPAG